MVGYHQGPGDGAIFGFEKKNNTNAEPLERILSSSIRNRGVKRGLCRCKQQNHIAHKRDLGYVPKVN
jgi:hypothetical protein